MGWLENPKCLYCLGCFQVIIPMVTPDTSYSSCSPYKLRHIHNNKSRSFSIPRPTNSHTKNMSALRSGSAPPKCVFDSVPLLHFSFILLVISANVTGGSEFVKIAPTPPRRRTIRQPSGVRGSSLDEYSRAGASFSAGTSRNGNPFWPAIALDEDAHVAQLVPPNI